LHGDVLKFFEMLDLSNGVKEYLKLQMYFVDHLDTYQIP